MARTRSSYSAEAIHAFEEDDQHLDDSITSPRTIEAMPLGTSCDYVFRIMDQFVDFAICRCEIAKESPGEFEVTRFLCVTYLAQRRERAMGPGFFFVSTDLKSERYV